MYGVPVNESKGQYQCISLRQRVHEICIAGIERIHFITRHLVEEYSLNIELDNKDTYLAYRTANTTQYDELSLENLKVMYIHTH